MVLEKLSLEELKKLQNEVAVAIFNFEKQRKAETLIELKALAHAKGFSLKELLDDSNGKSTKKPVAPKYADPSNPENTWTGRGRNAGGAAPHSLRTISGSGARVNSAPQRSCARGAVVRRSQTRLLVHCGVPFPIQPCIYSGT